MTAGQQLVMTDIRREEQVQDALLAEMSATPDTLARQAHGIGDELQKSNEVRAAWSECVTRFPGTGFGLVACWCRC